MQANALSRLVELERGARVEAALALFDSLPAVAPEAMLGAWRGRGLPTGAELLRRPLAASIGKRLTRLLRTGRPKARLRSTEFRGVISATMIYDTLPILAVFRRVDHDTLVGVMDLRGAPFFVFTQRREP